MSLRVSERKLLELLNMIETYCSWFLDTGSLDLNTWKRVGTDFASKWSFNPSNNLGHMETNPFSFKTLTD